MQNMIWANALKNIVKNDRKGIIKAEALFRYEYYFIQRLEEINGETYNVRPTMEDLDDFASLVNKDFSLVKGNKTVVLCCTNPNTQAVVEDLEKITSIASKNVAKVFEDDEILSVIGASNDELLNKKYNRNIFTADEEIDFNNTKNKTCKCLGASFN